MDTTDLRSRVRVAACALLFAVAAASSAQEPEAVEPAASENPTPAAETTAVEASAPVAETIPVDPVRVPAESPAVAEGGATLDTIEVTGSRIRRTDYETAQPVLVVGRDDIERSGLTSIGDLLQELSTAGAALNTTYNNGGTGTVEVDLRHLGSNRVLVLVNGRRWVNGLRSFATSAVDLTTIPISVIERVEVLKDGASAIYGSDAIAGVVNIVTRKDFDAFELRAQYGAYDAGDGVTQAYNLTYGDVFERGSWFLDGSFARQDDVFAGDREEFKTLIPGAGRTRGSGFIPEGRFLFVPEPQTELLLRAADPRACPGLVNAVDDPIAIGGVNLCDIKVREGTLGESFADFERYDADKHAYETAVSTYLVTPNERQALFGQFSYSILDSMNLDVELLYNRRISAQQLAAQPLALGDLIPFPFFNPIYVDATNPFNPLGQDIGRGANGTPLAPGSGAVARRPLEAGPRLFTQTVDTYRGGLALGGPLDLEVIGVPRLLDWQLSYTYAESGQEEVTTGLFDVFNLKRALGPIAECDADPACVPLNVFGGQFNGGTITKEMLDYVTYVGVGTTNQVMQNAQLNFSTELFQAPWAQGSGVGFAIGFEYREEEYENNPDPFVAIGRSSTNRASATQGGYETREMFAELSIPLAREAALAHELDLSIAGRHSDYARFGKSNTGKLGLRWKPVESFMVRGTASTAFRAPSLGELFLGNSDSFTGLADPCDSSARPTPATPDTPDPTSPDFPVVPGAPNVNDPALTANANATQNCASDGVNPTLVQLVPQLIEVFRGNPDLRPEKAETFTGGIVYSPGWLRDVNFYVDWYKISIRDYISVPGAQTILNYCYLADPDERLFCEKVNRDPNTGAIIFIDDPFLNYARLETEGVDLGFDARLPWPEGLGKLKLVLDSTYLSKYDLYAPTPDGRELKDPNAQPGRHFFFNVQSLPRWKANASLALNSGGFSASYSLRYIHRLRETCFDGIPPSLSDLGLCSHPDPNNDPEAADGADARGENELPAVIYHSAQLGYEIERWGTKIVLGVNNLLDEDPPVSYFASPLYGFDPSLYEVPGRQGYLRMVITY